MEEVHRRRAHVRRWVLGAAALPPPSLVILLRESVARTGAGGGVGSLF
jgi:hypothetical protein